MKRPPVALNQISVIGFQLCISSCSRDRFRGYQSYRWIFQQSEADGIESPLVSGILHTIQISHVKSFGVIVLQLRGFIILTLKASIDTNKVVDRFFDSLVNGKLGLPAEITLGPGYVRLANLRVIFGAC